MNHRQFFRFPVPFLFLILVLTLSGCSKKGSSEASSSFTPGETHVLVPQADGSNTIGGDPCSWIFLTRIRDISLEPCQATAEKSISSSLGRTT